MQRIQCTTRLYNSRNLNTLEVILFFVIAFGFVDVVYVFSFFGLVEIMFSLFSKIETFNFCNRAMYKATQSLIKSFTNLMFLLILISGVFSNE